MQSEGTGTMSLFILESLNSSHFLQFLQKGYLQVTLKHLLPADPPLISLHFANPSADLCGGGDEEASKFFGCDEFQKCEERRQWALFIGFL